MINNTFVMKERQDHFGYKYETRSDSLIIMDSVIIYDFTQDQLKKGFILRDENGTSYIIIDIVDSPIKYKNNIAKKIIIEDLQLSRNKKLEQLGL